MHKELIKYLRSPVSNTPLLLEVFEEGPLGKSPSHILSGRLYNSAGEEYPIILGVPRLLTGKLLHNAVSRYPEWVTINKKHFNSLGKTLDSVDNNVVLHDADGTKEQSQEMFGVSWNLFNNLDRVWKDTFNSYITPLLKLEDFHNKKVLDCGCGMGRYLYYLAEEGTELSIGIDLSHAVDAAVKNVAHLENVHIIQADIYNLPVPAIFDIVYSVGVIQHLPDPLKGFLSVASRRKKRGGKIFATLYGRRHWSYNLVVGSLRHITIKMNTRMLYYFSFILTVFSTVLFDLPRRFLTAIGLEKLGKLVPWSRYADFPFRASHADWYDRLAAPKTAYLTSEEGWEMLQSAGCEKAYIYPRPEYGSHSWNLLGM